MADSDTDRDVHTPMLDPQQQTPTTSSWGVGCLLAIVLLQSIGVDHIDALVRADARNIIKITEWFESPFLILGAVLIYVLPILVGIYTDVYAGRYTSLFYGLCLRTTGSLLGTIVIFVFEDSSDINTIQMKCLVALYTVSLVLILVGAIFLGPALLTFGKQQISYASRDLTSTVRWGIWFGLVGTLIHRAYDECNRIYDFYGETSRYYNVVGHGVMFLTDGLSVAIFLLGKVRYARRSTEDGLNSWKEMVNIIRTHVFCMRQRRSFDDTLASVSTPDEDEEEDRILQRLKLRKGVLMIALFSSNAVALAMIFMLHRVFDLNKQRWQPTLLKHLVQFSEYLLIVLAVPTIACLKRRECEMWGNGKTNRMLKAMGIAASLVAVSLLIGGALDSVLWGYGLQFMSAAWLLPQYLVMGVAILLLSTSGLAFCLSESPPGLETFVVSVAACLAVLSLIVEALLKTKFLAVDVYRYDITCYILASITVAMLVVVFIPVSIWYLRVEETIAKHILSTGGSPSTIRSRDGASEGTAAVTETGRNAGIGAYQDSTLSSYTNTAESARNIDSNLLRDSLLENSSVNCDSVRLGPGDWATDYSDEEYSLTRT